MSSPYSLISSGDNWSPDASAAVTKLQLSANTPSPEDLSPSEDGKGSRDGVRSTQCYSGNILVDPCPRVGKSGTPLVSNGCLPEHARRTSPQAARRSARFLFFRSSSYVKPLCQRDKRIIIEKRFESEDRARPSVWAHLASAKTIENICGKYRRKTCEHQHQP